MANRTTYFIEPIVVNGTRVVQVIIDDHYKVKHLRSVNDYLILELVNLLDGRRQLPEADDGKFSYFTTLVNHKSKQYRLIWLTEKNRIFVGVINVFRDRRRI